MLTRNETNRKPRAQWREIGLNQCVPWISLSKIPRGLNFTISSLSLRQGTSDTRPLQLRSCPIIYRYQGLWFCLVGSPRLLQLIVYATTVKRFRLELHLRNSHLRLMLQTSSECTISV
jgi:hypothetical protein